MRTNRGRQEAATNNQLRGNRINTNYPRRSSVEENNREHVGGNEVLYTNHVDW